MSDPRFHWDSFLFGACVGSLLQVAFGDYLPEPLWHLDSETKLILGLAGLGCSLLYFIHVLHKPSLKS